MSPKLRNSLFLSGLLVVLVASVATAQSSITDEFAEAAEREGRIIEEIDAINDELRQVTADLENARRLVNKSELTLEEAAQQQEILDARINELSGELSEAAVEGYVSSDGQSADRSNPGSVTQRLRAENLLSRVQNSRAEMIAELESLNQRQELVDYQREQAERIRADNVRIQEEKEAVLQERQARQRELYEQVKTQLDDLQAEAIASAELDDELRQLILERQRNSATIDGPLRWPLDNYRITSPFGYRRHPIYGGTRLHAGMDLCPASGSCSGARLNASGPGTVIFTGVKSGYGNTVIIDHGGGITTLYAHLSSISVSNGTQVLGQEQIGRVGASGNVTGAHLHLEVRVNGVAKNPADFLS